MSEKAQIPGISEEDLPELEASARVAAAGSDPLDKFIAEVLGRKPVDAPKD